MPRGLADLSRADQCDAAALLNLLHFCDYFSFISQRLITEVIRCRNELMHSCEMQVSNEWMTHFQKSLEQLLLTLRHVPEVAAAGQQIQEEKLQNICRFLNSHKDLEEQFRTELQSLQSLKAQQLQGVNNNGER
ncbi:uncharacterized protein CXorf38-like [Neoarius graeffei]|uniref:uncharacterized protein CXorf38-like n=1 Tax=Neoarius graeffei TaxID=443677 RepID=UPI00298C01D7|nr:uncharacterized protein CXorf38-like [Neoarius graeffei]